MVNYQVFLSFRGPDTRDNLVQYLYNELDRLGIVAFLDREEIQYGDRIGATIEDAIERSDICVPVFSQDFASSPACLMEVTQMVASRKKILPIFFFVEPCDVRHQRGTYRKSFAEHESKKYYPESTIKDWKDALKKIAESRGPEFKKADLEAALKAAMEAALGAIGGVNGSEFKEAALEAALKAALEAALGEIGFIKGPESKKAAPGEINGTKGRFYKDLFSGFRELEDFISRLGKLLNPDKQEVTKYLVGIDRDVPQLVRTLGFDYQDGRVVRKQEMTGRMVFVVWGMAGVGKTTLAKEVYNNIRHLFDKSSFLENVRRETTDKNVEYLQNKLIDDLRGGVCQKVKYSNINIKKIQHQFRGDRVLIVLDNVDNLEQIKPLAEEVTWFGPGSIIILTSRTREMITHYKVLENSKIEDLCVREHEVSSMNEDDALELFYKYALELDDLPENFDDLSRQITSAVGCLPFTIEIVGKYLRGKSNEIWREAPGRFKGGLVKQLEILFKENYDFLSEDAKEIFLDVACFFRGVKLRNPYYMWNAQGRCPHTCFDELQNMSFLKIGEENEFWMHNQLEIFGRKTVKENCEDPGERSRLWDYEDVQKTLREKQVIKKVNALRVTPNPNRDLKINCFHWKDFLHLPQLRFLDLDSVDIKGSTEDVLPYLVWLNWHGCREKSLLFALNMEKLVILDLCSSQVKLSLEDWRTLMRKAKLLKVLNAKDCPLIFASLKFPNEVLLERLILEGCLLEIPTDPRLTSGLVNLVTLNMKGCTHIKSLPQALCSLQALKELFIDGTKIKRLEFKGGSLPLLEILSACECKDLVDVDSITFLKKLQKLTLRSCEKLKKLPAVIGELDRLQELDLSYTLIGELPSSVENLKNLEVLKMVRTNIEGFPKAIKDLYRLKELDFTHCRSMKGECIITGLDSLRILRLKGTGIFRVLVRDNGNFCLQILDLDNGVNGQTAS
ncbi:hypothetical protein BT93_B1441 [Corymbia citriodora subsp. variegata]|nr:hypothetical protein BT93_B1441 [Corymbia citriodora subsp. variegata]